MARIEKTVFLSYRRTDFPWALAIFKHLTHDGFDVFFDYMGISSGDFESAILDNIRARAHFLVVLSPSALNRCKDPGDWLRREVEEALACRRNLVPLFVNGFEFNASVNSLLTGPLNALQRYNGVGVPAEYFEAAMEKLCGKYLNIPLDAVLHPPSSIAADVAREQRSALSTDALTGLLNRREFEYRLERILENEPLRRASVVCYLDLDRFKTVNDTCGHAAGDELLRATGELLKSKMRARDVLARLGGDEFAVVLGNCDLDEATAAAQFMRATIAGMSFSWRGKTIQIRASVGVTPIFNSAEDAASVISAAERACFLAKAAGRNRVHTLGIDDTERIEHAAGTHRPTRTVGSPIEDRIEIYLQTICSLQKTETVHRYELILQMRDGTGALLAPAEVDSAIERGGSVPNLDRWVVETALQWLATNTGASESPPSCSVNLSARAFGDLEFPVFIDRSLRSYGVDAARICFELNECSVVDRLAQSIRLAHELKALGCAITLDNFGTGVSALSHLKSFPLDFIKIDGGFTREIHRDLLDRELVGSIQSLAKVLLIETIAERCDSPEVLEVVRKLGVGYAQGEAVSSMTRITSARQ